MVVKAEDRAQADAWASLSDTCDDQHISDGACESHCNGRYGGTDGWADSWSGDLIYTIVEEGADSCGWPIAARRRPASQSNHPT